MTTLARNWTLGLVALVALVSTALAGIEIALAGIEHGDPMPLAERKMIGTDDQQVSLADVKGEKGTVVMFWCNHCPFVKKYRERFNDLVKAYQDQGIGFVAVNSNDPNKVKGDSLDAMKEHAKKYGYAYKYVVDEGSELARAFGATHTPHTFLFDAEGKLVYTGSIDDSADGKNIENHYLKDNLAALAAGKDVPVKQSKAFGCTIKFAK